MLEVVNAHHRRADAEQSINQHHREQNDYCTLKTPCIIVFFDEDDQPGFYTST